MHDLTFRGHGHLGFEGVHALFDAVKARLVLGPPHGLFPWLVPLLDFRLPPGLLSTTHHDIGQLGEDLQELFERANLSWLPVLLSRRFVRPCLQGPGTQGSRQRLLQDGQHRMDVPADVRGVQVKKNAQDVHGEVLAQRGQRDQQARSSLKVLPAPMRRTRPARSREQRWACSQSGSKSISSWSNAVGLSPTSRSKERARDFSFLNRNTLEPTRFRLYCATGLGLDADSRSALLAYGPGSENAAQVDAEGATVRLRVHSVVDPDQSTLTSAMNLNKLFTDTRFTLNLRPRTAAVNGVSSAVPTSDIGEVVYRLGAPSDGELLTAGSPLGVQVKARGTDTDSVLNVTASFGAWVRVGNTDTAAFTDMPVSFAKQIQMNAVAVDLTPPEVTVTRAGRHRARADRHAERHGGRRQHGPQHPGIRRHRPDCEQRGCRQRCGADHYE